MNADFSTTVPFRDFAARRNRMVAAQIEMRDVNSPRVLEAMRKVERHRFVDREFWDNAYEDYPLPIGHGQTISQPYVVALMSQSIAEHGVTRVLEVGTGSGYQSAVLAELCEKVYTIEIIERLALRARELLRTLGYTNVEVLCGDGSQGWPEFAPYDGIIVTCAPTQIPQPLRDQLQEGGIMAIPVGGTSSQDLEILHKENGILHRSDAVPVRFVPMVDKSGKTY